MMKIGDLFKSKHTNHSIVEIIKFYNRRDIDDECPLSVAIIPTVVYIVLTGDDMGKEYRCSRRNFGNRFSPVEAVA